MGAFTSEQQDRAETLIDDFGLRSLDTRERDLVRQALLAALATPAELPALPSREEIARALFDVALADVKANGTASRFGYLTKDDINVLADATLSLFAALHPPASVAEGEQGQ